MKNKIIFMFLSVLLLSACETTKGIVRGIAEAYGGYAIEGIAKVGGCTDEQAQKFREDIYNGIGASNANADLGVKYATSDNAFEKQNAVKDLLWNNSGIESGKYGEIMSVIKQINDVQIDYIRDKKSSMDDQSVASARHKRDSTLEMIGYDMYQTAKEKRARYLAEKLNMKEQLIAKGVDPNLAIEAAGTLIAIRNNSEMSEEEKQMYYDAFGLSESMNEVWKAIDEVSQPDYANDLKAPQEIKEDSTEVIVFPCAKEFEFNKAALSDENKSKLDEVASILCANEDIKIRVTGHTCNIGAYEVNYQLGLKRANSAKEYLVSKGIQEDRIVVESKGAEAPLNDNSTESRRSANRRVEITLQ